MSVLLFGGLPLSPGLNVERVCVVLWLLLGVVSVAAGGQKEQAEAVALIEKAREVSDIQAEGGPSFQLRAHLQLKDLEGASFEGTYLVFWSSPEKWREELSFPGYSDTLVAQEGKVWDASNVDHVPYVVFRILQALQLHKTLISGSDLKVKRVRDAKLDGTPAKCAEIAPARTDLSPGALDEGEFCFDSRTGYLVRRVDEIWNTSYEYADYAPGLGKEFPRTLRVFQNGDLVAEIRVEELTLEPNPGPALFLPPSGATLVDVVNCKRRERPKLSGARAKSSYVAPNYPPDAKRERKNGSVRLYAEIGTDGRPRGLSVVRSTSPEFARAALQAVKQWRYQPTTCDGIPVRVVTHIDVIFTMS